jgi:hypothetical protein
MNYSDDWLFETYITKEEVKKIKKILSETIVENRIPNRFEIQSTTGDIQQYSLHKLLDSHIHDLVKSKTKEILIENNILKIENNLNHKASWTVYGQEGSYHTTHNHSQKGFESKISTVLYLDCPKSYSHSGLFYAFFRSNEIILKEPEIGKLIIFPSWIYHGTYPQPKGLRHTLSIDFTLNVNLC